MFHHHDAFISLASRGGLINTNRILHILQSVADCGLVDSWFVDTNRPITIEEIEHILSTKSSAEAELGVGFGAWGEIKGICAIGVHFSGIGTRHCYEKDFSNPTVLDSECFSLRFDQAFDDPSHSRFFSLPNLLTLFKACVNAWTGCYYGVFGSQQLSNLQMNIAKQERDRLGIQVSPSVDARYVPQSVSWLSYYGKQYVQTLDGVSEIKRRLSGYTIEAFHEGVVICAVDEPFDYQRQIHIDRALAIPRLLDFESLRKAYPWPKPENVKPTPFQPNETIDSTMKAIARRFRERTAEKTGVQLSFTQLDIQRLDDLISNGTLPWPESAEPQPEASIGAFFGESLVQNFKGYWTTAPGNDEEPVVAIPSRMLLIKPVEKVRLRLKNGQVDSLAYLYEVTKKQVESK